MRSVLNPKDRPKLQYKPASNLQCLPTTSVTRFDANSTFQAHLEGPGDLVSR